MDGMDGFGLPTGFGKQVETKHDVSAQIAQTKRADATGSSTAAVLDLTKASAPTNDGEDAKGKSRALEAEEDVEANGEEAAEEDEDELPITHQVVLSSHTKAVSALSLDPSGARVASGGYDYSVKLWDFGGMSSKSFSAFRSWEAKEGHQVKEVVWSNTGDGFLCVNGTNMAQRYDRDGGMLCEYNKGDMYIRDMRHCAGHIAEISSAAWHPKDPSTFITGAADSTIRIWNVDDRRKSKNVIVVKSKQPGTRTKVTACGYSPDGKTIAAACQDGTLHLWSTTSNFARPNATIENAHRKDTHTSSLCFSKDCKTLVTRGGDDTVKVWDTKAFKKPVATRDGLVSLYEETNVIFSPDERFVLTGVAADKSAGLEGRVVMLARGTLEIVRSISISPAHVIRVLWHPKINQIVTGSSSGAIHVLYSPQHSIRGATLSLSRIPRKATLDDSLSSVDIDRPIFTPHALPAFKDEVNVTGEGGERDGVAAMGRGGKRKRERERQDSKATMKPMPPLTGPGRGGRVGASATQHVVQGLVKDSIRHEDPREALLKFAQQHEGDNPQWTKAWEGNKVVLDERLLKDEEREEEEKGKREEERKRLKRERPAAIG